MPGVRSGMGMARGMDASAPGTGSRQDAGGSGAYEVERGRELKLSGSTPNRYSPVKRGSRLSTNAINASAVSRDENIKACAMPSDSMASAIV